jgi:hypothetical protein
MPTEPVKKVQIRGRVTDFDKRPIEGADIVVVDQNFSPIQQTTSDQKGNYSLEVTPGIYTALLATRGYKTENLEYWAWNVPALKNLVIDPLIDGVELYAINAFMPQGGPASLFIYFRPMSLTRINAYVKKEGGAKDKIEFYDIAPELTMEDIEIKISGKKVKIIDVFRIREQTSNLQAMAAYMVQCVFEGDPSSTEYAPVEITITDSKTNEKGSACVFWKKG